MHVHFLGDRQQLDQLLPPGLGLQVGEVPIVSVIVDYGTEIEWLAGRGYNTLGVSFPVVFHGREDDVAGQFLVVLWESMCDPILTGRDELGYPKLYCDLPEPRIHGGRIHSTASWMGFRFCDIELKNLAQSTAEEAISALDRVGGDGVLMHKYIPRTGEWGTAEISYITMTPSSGGHERIEEVWRGAGTVEFHQATWEDMPTQFHIVNALRNLEVKEYLDAWMIKTVGGKDLRDQRILR
jgi:hypothetical protein